MVKATLLISVVYLYVLRVMAFDHLEFFTSSGEEFDYLFWSGAPIGISGEPKIPNVKCPRDGCQKGLSKGMQVLNWMVNYAKQLSTRNDALAIADLKFIF